MAASAPASLSTATIGTRDWLPDPTATTGTALESLATALTAEICGAMTTMPSTPWSRRRSTASWSERLSSERRLATLTKYPALLAACSIPSSIEAGPYSALAKLTTPSVCERRVTSARAAEFGR